MTDKKKIDPVPEHFATYDEAAEFWDTHDTIDYSEIFRTIEEGSRGGHKKSNVSKPAWTCMETQSDFAYWSGLPSLTTETREAIRQADIVLVPDPGFGDHVGPIFPVGTGEFYQWLREKAQVTAKVELAVEDADYRELVLHSDVVRIATLLVKWLAASLAVDLIKDYLKERLGDRFKGSKVYCTLIVDQSHGETRKAVQLSYEGPADTLVASMKQALESPVPSPRETHVQGHNNPGAVPQSK